MLRDCSKHEEGKMLSNIDDAIHASAMDMSATEYGG